MDNKTPPQSPQAPAEEKETASCPLCGDEFPDRWVKVLVQCTKPRTPQDMDGTLTLIFANTKTVWDFVTKFSAFLKTGKNLVLVSLTTFEKFKIEMGVAGSFFEPHPSNLVRIRFFLSCTNAEIFVVIS